MEEIRAKQKKEEKESFKGNQKVELGQTIKKKK